MAEPSSRRGGDAEESGSDVVTRIPLSKPYLNEDLKRGVLAVLDSGYWTEGPVTRAFEDLCRRHIGCAHALAVCNCSVGLEMALRVLGIGPGDEVIVPDYTYPVTAAVVNIVGATIVLADVERDTMLLDLDALEAALTPRTKAVMPVSIFGLPLAYDRLNKLKERHGFFVIEDAACSIGTEYRGRKTGDWADISAFSFYPRKFIATGEGGLVTTNNPAWAAWMDSYKHFGMRSQATREDTVFEMLGTNYKLSNILAAVGHAQMVVIGDLLARRREQANRYVELLGSDARIEIPRVIAGGLPSYQAFCVLIHDRDRVMRELRARGIEVQIGSYALHLHPAFRPSALCRHAGDLENSRYVFEHALALPLYHELTKEEQNEVVSQLLSTLSK
jgi:perosamine synthetase